ncbi:MAG: hypothetical protein JW881_17030 [Spirochaetales bacterium]|nr:hypothetical protein [Spirochaetales bacterium]
MKEIDFFRTERKGYDPKTPSAAIKAYEEGILPIEHFIYMSTSLHPIDEWTYDVDSIDRIIAREDLTIQENLLLMKILETMVKSKDMELAVFAAESINLIEARYTEKIEKLKNERMTAKESGAVSGLARLYYELALLNEQRASIKTFYLKEAFFYAKELVTTRKIKKRDVELIIDILLALKLYDHALYVLDTINGKDEPFFILLKARVEFARKNYGGTHSLLMKLSPVEDQLDEDDKNLFLYWNIEDEK